MDRQRWRQELARVYDAQREAKEKLAYLKDRKRRLWNKMETTTVKSEKQAAYDERAKLTENIGQVQSHLNFLRGRIEDLKYKLGGPGDSSSGWRPRRW